MDVKGLIPTDNLYKFLAISGLALALYSFVVPLDMARQLERENVLNLGERKHLLLNWTQLEELASEHKKDTDNLTKRVLSLAEKNREMPAELREEFKIQLYASIKNKNELIKKKHEFKLNELAYNNKLAVYKFNKVEAKKQKLISYFAGFCGVLMTVAGFCLWYIRIQKWHDRLLKEGK